jgi:hypothetical protein
VDEIAKKVREENERPDVKTLIFADTVKFGGIIKSKINTQQSIGTLL